MKQNIIKIPEDAWPKGWPKGPCGLVCNNSLSMGYCTACTRNPNDPRHEDNYSGRVRK